MKNKMIVFTAPYRAELLESEIPEIGKDEVLVKMAFSSISSGTERANFIGDPNISIYSDSKEASFPRTVGYSSSGTVVKIGAGVTSLQAGDRVAMAGSIHS